ncbi:MAG: hypothetical protein KY433_12915 [Actinobacteria bacterium]|nr:hypothetical protein [Actinomycetota bacterium]
MIPLPIDPRLPEILDAIRRHRALYAIARHDSLVSPQQFERFCRLVGIPLSPVDDMTPFADPVSVAGLWTQTSSPSAETRRMYGLEPRRSG